MPETVARDRLSKRTQRKLVRRKSIRKIILLVVLFLFLSIGGTAGAIMWNVNDTLNKVTGEFCKTKRRLPYVLESSRTNFWSRVEMIEVAIRCRCNKTTLFSSGSFCWTRTLYLSK